MLPSDGGRGLFLSWVPRTSHYPKVYCNTSPFTYPAPIFQKKTKTNATRAAGWEDAMCSTNFTVFQERLFHSELQADPVVGSGWLGHIYLFIPCNDFFLEEPALSTPCPHIPHYLTTPNMSTHIWIPWKIPFRQQVTPPPPCYFSCCK